MTNRLFPMTVERKSLAKRKNRFLTKFLRRRLSLLMSFLRDSFSTQAAVTKSNRSTWSPLLRLVHKESTITISTDWVSLCLKTSRSLRLLSETMTKTSSSSTMTTGTKVDSTSYWRRLWQRNSILSCSLILDRMPKKCSRRWWRKASWESNMMRRLKKLKIRSSE